MKTSAITLRSESQLGVRKTELEHLNRYLVTNQITANGLSLLARSPDNGPYILGKCTMKNLDAIDTTMLYFHCYLQYINLAYNNISKVPSFADIPWCMTSVNFSYNQISEMDYLSAFWSLKRLDLSHNIIYAISGLQNLKYLQYLNLSYNLIECVENLDYLNIHELNLEGNSITSFKFATPNDGFNTLFNLHTLILGYNKVSTLRFLKDVYSLRIIDLKFNRISDLLEISNIKGSLYELDFRGNLCTKWPNYKDVLLSSVPSVMFIDGAKVSITEKMSASTLLYPQLELIAARTITKLILLEQLTIPKIDLHVIPYDQINPPLIILTGPSAVKKTKLALHITERIPKKVKYCQWYSTKKMEDENDKLKAYIHVEREKFHEMAQRGNFLAVQELLGNSYGFHIDQIISLISEKKIGLTQIDLHGAIEIQKNYSNVKPILVLTKNENIHRTWAHEKFAVYKWIRSSIQDLLAIEIDKHEETNDLESAINKADFIKTIMDKITDHLDLPTYSIFVRPQGTGATTTDIILENRMMLPKVIKTKSEINEAKKDENDDDHAVVRMDCLPTKHKQELKIIFDERSNIIMNEVKTKPSCSEGLLSDEISILKYSEKFYSDTTKSTEYLKYIYTELVIKSRRIYLDHHLNHPGFFSLVLFTDDYISSSDLLACFVHELCTRQSFYKAQYSQEIVYFKEVAIPSVFEDVVKSKLKKLLSISKIQQKTQSKSKSEVTSWKNIISNQIVSKYPKDYVNYLKKVFKNSFN